MTMAAAMQSRTAESPSAVESEPYRACRYRHAISARPRAVWRAFEEPGHLFTPYQRFDLLEPWQRLVGEHEGAPSLHRHRPRRRAPAAPAAAALAAPKPRRAYRLLHGRQAHDLQHGPVERRVSPRRPLPPISTRCLRRCATHVDVLALTQQPLRWHDQQNPFALLPRQSSINGCPLLAMEPGGPPASRISNSFRRRLKSKEKKLQALAGYRYHLATIGCGRHPPARLVLPRQAGADGRTEAAERLRRAGRRSSSSAAPACRRAAKAASSTSMRSNATTR